MDLNSDTNKEMNKIKISNMPTQLQNVRHIRTLCSCRIDLQIDLQLTKNNFGDQRKEQTFSECVMFGCN